MSGHGGNPKKVVRAALVANLAIAIAKFVAAGLSGSTTMLAEAVHSLADTANQALLWVGMALSERRPDDRFPFGRASESYFWSFVVALLLFFLGGVFAIYEGIHKLGSTEPPGAPWAPLVVVGVSLVIESASFVVAWREFKKTRGDKSYREALFEGKDPVIPVVLLEDSGAVLGLAVAFVTILVTWLTGSDIPDGIGSITIGVLLCTVGLLLARDTRSLLIGEGVTREVRVRAIELAEQTPGVESVRQFLSLHLGPDTVLLALKVRFARGLALADIERVTDELEANVRAELPMMKRIFVEPDSDYEAARDADAVPLGAPAPTAPAHPERTRPQD
ncbi:MAG: cation transporter [Myxococcales bacterium]|nr:cation transporter [Myxococcales bacterium]